MTDEFQPRNPCIRVLDASSGAEGRRDLRAQLKAGLAAGDVDYVLQLESEEDFKDADSILAALALEPEILRRHPSFNTWQTNPLFGIDKADIDVLLARHLFTYPRWFREECDLSVRPMKLIPSQMNPGFMGVAMAFENPATHLALLAAASDSCVTSEVFVHGANEIEVNLIKQGVGERVFLFGSTSVQSDPSMTRVMDELRHIAVDGGPVTVLLPVSIDAIAKILPKDVTGSLYERLGKNDCMIVPGYAALGSSRARLDAGLASEGWVRALRAA